MDQDPSDQASQNGQTLDANQTDAADAVSETAVEANNTETPAVPENPAPASENNEAIIAAALNEAAAPAPMQPLMMSSAKPAKSRRTRKQKAAENDDEHPAATEAKTKPTPKKAKMSRAAKSSEKATKKPVKKSKTGLIVALILVFLLLLSLAGIAIWYLVYYSKPEVATFDAIRQALSAENAGVSGQVYYEYDNEGSSAQLKSVTLDFTSVSSSIPNSLDATMQVDLRDDPDFSLSLGVVQMEDGLVYLRVSGIMDTIDAAELDSDLKKEISTALELAEEVDDEWWEVSLVDVMKSMGADRDRTELYDDMCTCYTETMKSGWSTELAGSYDKHRFAEVEKVNQVDTDGHWFTYQPSFASSLYKISFNKRELANFLNELPEGQTAHDFVDCYNEAMKTYMKSQGYTSRYRSSYLLDTDDIDEISAYDLNIPKEMNFYIEVSDFGHRLKRLLMSYEPDNDSGITQRLSVNLAFDYRKVVVSAPTSYKPLTDLTDDDRLEDAIYELRMTPYYRNRSYQNNYYDYRNFAL